MLGAFHFKSVSSAFFCVFCLLVSELLSGLVCPSFWCALVVVSSVVLVALGSWLCVISVFHVWVRYQFYIISENQNAVAGISSK